jgi:hypothetical protein
MEGGTTKKNIRGLEKKAFVHPYVEVLGFHKIIQSSHGCK